MLTIGNIRNVAVAILFICTTSAGTHAGNLPLPFTWEELPRIRAGVQAHLASSYDRTGANADYSNYESPSGLILDEVPATVATVQGPGMVTRFWMPHVMARRNFVVKMYFDNEQTPRIDTTSTVIMSRLFSYFTDPNLIDTFAGGWTCYEPIPFARSLRIETVNKNFQTVWENRHYYQYSYSTFSSDANIASYWADLSSNPDLQQARAGMSRMFACRGQYPGTTDGSANIIERSEVMVQPGESLDIEAEGPGSVRKLFLRLSDPNDENLQHLSLRIYYDGAQHPSIDVPVADFFGAGEGRALYASLPLGTSGPNGSFYCYFTMPFYRSIRVSLYNTGLAGIRIASASVEYSLSSFAGVQGYFMAAMSSTTKTAGQTYHTILSRTGVGHYVGDLTYAQQDSGSFYFLEGDDVITVDQKETQFGTGTEDAYNGGAYYNWVVVQNDEPEGPNPHAAARALNGILYVDKTATFARADQYRWRITDCIPFTSSISVNLECRYGITGARWRSVAFWYELPDLLDFSDLARIAVRWMDRGCGDCGGVDLTGDGNVDQADLARLAEGWLSVQGPHN